MLNFVHLKCTPAGPPSLQISKYAINMMHSVMLTSGRERGRAFPVIINLTLLMCRATHKCKKMFFL